MNSYLHFEFVLVFTAHTLVTRPSASIPSFYFAAQYQNEPNGQSIHIRIFLPNGQIGNSVLLICDINIHISEVAVALNFRNHAMVLYVGLHLYCFICDGTGAICPTRRRNGIDSKEEKGVKFKGKISTDTGPFMDISM